ncbi:MAG: lysophospholipid acyltransferase family protein [bacterium]|nr:lysophospholipid acyltransferase family protein [bacterium]
MPNVGSRLNRLEIKPMPKDAQYDLYKKQKSTALKPLRHWAEWVLLASFKGFCSTLSIGTNQRMGRALGRLIYRFAKRDLGVGRYQLSFALPELDEDQRESLMLECAENVGQTLFEALAIDRFAKDPDRWIELQGREVVESIKASGSGALLLFGHFGNWELIPVVYQMLDIHGLAPESPIGAEKLDRMLVANRTNDHFTVIPRGTGNSAKELLKSFKHGGFYLMAIDQDLARVKNHFVDFFGKPAATAKGAATLAQKFKVPVLSLFGQRLADGRHLYRICLLAEPPYQGGEEENLRLTQSFSSAYEAHIRTSPGQWVWFHRRWKTRPEDPVSDSSEELP